MAACSPTQRMVAGGGMTAVGLAVTAVALDSMAGSCPQQRRPDGTCANPASPTSFSGGLPIALGGVGIAFLGGVVMVTAAEHGSSSPSRTGPAEAPPAYPTVLSETEAVGMAVARLVVSGMDGHGKRLELLEVEGARSSLSVEGNHAELKNLRVQTSPDRTWLTLDVCYEYTSEWRVTALGTNQECTPQP